MNILEMMTEAVSKLNEPKHESHVVICTGRGLLANGLCSFNGEQVDPAKTYMVELANYPFNMTPTSMKAFER